MPLFSSQFDRARQHAREYAGETGERAFWTPEVIGTAAGAALGIAAVAAVVGADPADSTGAGEGWDDGWGATADTSGAGAETAAGTGEDGGAWSERLSDDASIGGDGDFFYYFDGETSITLG